MRDLPIILAAALSAQTAAQAADPERGAELFEDCAVCHMIGQGAENAVGPHLNGLFGRRAATIDAFDYSDDLARAGADGLVWTAETLDVYIQYPRNLVTRTAMAYGGMEDAADRADLLAYLRQFSASPRDIPEAPPTAEPMMPASLRDLRGDPAYGEYLASECLTCHQEDGDYDGIPPIVGWPEEHFKAALHGYRIKARANEAMQLIAGSLTDEDIAALAVWFGSHVE
jgi:cytochrome c